MAGHLNIKNFQTLGMPFLAVQNSSIGDLVPCLVGWSVTTKGSPNRIHDPGIWALPVKGEGGSQPLPGWFGHFLQVQLGICLILGGLNPCHLGHLCSENRSSIGYFLLVRSNQSLVQKKNNQSLVTFETFD